MYQKASPLKAPRCEQKSFKSIKMYQGSCGSIALTVIFVYFEVVVYKKFMAMTKFEKTFLNLAKKEKCTTA